MLCMYRRRGRHCGHEVDEEQALKTIEKYDIAMCESCEEEEDRLSEADRRDG